MKRALVVLLALAAPALHASDVYPHPDTVVLTSRHAYVDLASRLTAAVEQHGMGVVAKASATIGARSLGVEIPGNMVVMVFHPRFAVRMLDASVPAGFEAPIRYYITEQPDGSTHLVYRKPSAVFAPYGNAGIDAMAQELDVIFARIAAQAVAQ